MLFACPKASYVDIDRRVPAKHPLRVIKAIVNDVLISLDAEFERLYEGTGRQSIAPASPPVWWQLYWRRWRLLRRH